MYQEVENGSSTLKKILTGINLVARSVGSTIGPKGRNVVISRNNDIPLITNDGVTIARRVNQVKDPWVNTGVQMIKQVSEKSDVVGDGTTTSTVLAANMASEALKHITVGISPMDLKAQIQVAYDKTMKELEKLAIPVTTKEQLIQVATVSVEDEEMGKIIGELMYDVGADGAITVETSRDTKLEKVKTDGISFGQGFHNYYYLQTVLERSRWEIDMKDVGIIVTNHTIEDQDQIMAITEKLLQRGVKELVIVCDDMKDEALQLTVENTQKRIFKYVVVRLPGLDEQRMQNGIDIAVACGAKFIDKDIDDLESAEVEDLGSAKRVIVKAYETVIVNGAGKKKDVNARVQELKKEREISVYPEDRDRLKERIARLSGGIGVIKVGTPTPSELEYKQHKLEDGLAATRAASEEGVVPGGGIALFNLYKEGKTPGEKIFYEALLSPIKQIAKNAGANPDTIIEKLREQPKSVGWNAKTGEYVDMIENGITDPVKVTKAALQNSTSMAIMFLGIGSHIVNVEDIDEKKER